MKKTYIAPAIEEIALSVETALMGASDISVVNEQLDASEAYSDKKNGIWDNNLWGSEE